MTPPALLDAARRFVAEHPYSLKRAPETFAGELAAWASSMVEAERERTTALMRFIPCPVDPSHKAWTCAECASLRRPSAEGERA